VDGTPASPREIALRLRAKSLLGSDVVLVPRILSTRAGGKSGALVFGWLVGRPAPGGDGGAGLQAVLGISPPLGSHLDLSQLGTPDEAVEDALRRRKDGEGPYTADALDLSPPEHVPGEARRAQPPRPRRRSESGLTTSSIDLPGV